MVVKTLQSHNPTANNTVNLSILSCVLYVFSRSLISGSLYFSKDQRLQCLLVVGFSAAVTDSCISLNEIGTYFCVSQGAEVMNSLFPFSVKLLSELRVTFSLRSETLHCELLLPSQWK